MNPADPLAQLHPLREPGLIGWWPPAPGWWLLSALALLTLAAGAWLLYRHIRRKAYRRAGLARLAEIERQYAVDRDRAAAAQAINAMLKGVALNAFPRRDIAAASGAEWLAFLNSTMPAGPGFAPASVTDPYRPDAGEIDIAELLQVARNWVVKHRVAP